MKFTFGSFSKLAIVAGCVLGIAVSALAESPKRAVGSSTTSKPAPVEMDMWDAIDSGDVEVKVIPKDSTGGNILVRNKSDKPLRIKLPAAFAAVPVAAQFGGGGMGGMGGGMGGMGGGMGGGQAMGGGGMGGGGMGGMGGGMGGMGGGGGGGFFNVLPEKVAKVKFNAVCLEHGKPDPKPSMAYQLKRIDEFTKDAELIEVCKMVATGKMDQRSAQAATWRLTDKMSWQELANKIGVKHLDGSVEPYFTAQQLEAAMNISREAARRAEEVTSSQTTAGKQESLSRQ